MRAISLADLNHNQYSTFLTSGRARKTVYFFCRLAADAAAVCQLPKGVIRHIKMLHTCSVTSRRAMPLLKVSEHTQWCQAEQCKILHVGSRTLPNSSSNAIHRVCQLLDTIE
jgi:hypothetical protein